MVNVFSDESDDGTTYALAGWVASPTGWDHLVPSWQEMLDTTPMPNGTPMRAFHSVDIVERDNVANSPFKGWSFEQEKAVFTRAVDIVVEQAQHGWLNRVGVSVHIPRNAGIVVGERDTTVWILLFGRFMLLLLEKYRAQQGFSYVFDNKDNVRAHVNQRRDVVQRSINKNLPGKWVEEGPVTFASDEKTLPLQAADLLAYEWRKRSSDRVLTPSKPVRKSYARLKAATQGHMLHYGPNQMAYILRRVTAGDSILNVMCDCDASEE
jgi:hypothetical protein